MLRILAGAVALWAALGLVGTAHALTYDVTVSDGTMTINEPVEGVLNADGTYSSDPNAASNLGMPGRWMFTEFDVFFNPDPSISSSFNITNTFGSASNFTITVEAPVAALATTVMGGSAQGGVTDAGGDGATLAIPSGSAFYTALIDAAGVHTLYPLANPPDPNLAYPPLVVGGFGSGNLFPLEDFGTPIPSLPGPAVNTKIGITWNFNLTPGNDRATGSGVFVVELPEPSTFLLLGFGLIGVAAFRRQH
jgi:hypothetical protein